MTGVFHGRDRKAHRIPARAGRGAPATPRTVTVVGGGIAGIAAAVGLGERGVHVHLVEPFEELGGRVRAWNVESDAGSVTMSRGFHAFFKQYYNLRSLLSRIGDLDTILRPVDDYPVVSAGGDRDSFAKIPRTPPMNFATFVLKSPTFTMRDLTKVNLDMALSLLDVDFPKTFSDLDGVSAAEFLDRLKFPDRARHLALEVFARSFFANPKDFSAGELVAMFHAYFLGSAEGLLFDVPRDDFDLSLWAPLARVLGSQGATIHTGEVTRVSRADQGGWITHLLDGTTLTSDAVVLAAGPEATPRIVANSPDLAHGSEAAAAWVDRVTNVELAPEFAVWRFWTDRPVNAGRPPFLGTAQYGPLDNISVLERFEAGAAEWARAHGGSVLELHAYAVPEGTDPAGLKAQLREELERVYPETRGMHIVAEEYLIERDCALVGLGAWHERPEVETPHDGILLAGDWVRCDIPVALMERAATTGWMAANALLQSWDVAGHDLWSVPTTARQRWPGVVRGLIAKR